MIFIIRTFSTFQVDITLLEVMEDGVVKAAICAIVNLIFNVNIYVIFFLIHYFQLDHDAPCLPESYHCSQFLLGITVAPREIQDNGYGKFWGVNKVHYIMVCVKMVNVAGQKFYCHISLNSL